MDEGKYNRQQKRENTIDNKQKKIQNTGMTPVAFISFSVSKKNIV